jgi:putative transposase
MRSLVDWEHNSLGIKKQCELLGLSPGALYYQPRPESELNLSLMALIDRQYLNTPFYGSRRMTVVANNNGYDVNRKRVARLMKVIGIEAIYPKPNLSKRNPEHVVYPYLLRGRKIERPNDVWSADITYIPMKHGFMYLVAIIDWYSRYVLSWKLSNDLGVEFCLDALKDAIKYNGVPTIFNVDQGPQFMARDFIKEVESNGILMSMDGRGRALDNIFIERLWRSLKYEDVYLNGGYADGKEGYQRLRNYFRFYNYERPHQSLEYRTPFSVHSGAIMVPSAI